MRAARVVRRLDANVHYAGFVRTRGPFRVTDRGVTEVSDSDAVTLDDCGLARFVEIAPGAGDLNTLRFQQRARIDHRIRTAVVTVVVRHRHGVEATVGEDVRHFRRLADLTRVFGVDAARGIRTHAIDE